MFSFAFRSIHTRIFLPWLASILAPSTCPDSIPLQCQVARCPWMSCHGWVAIQEMFLFSKIRTHRCFSPQTHTPNRPLVTLRTCGAGGFDDPPRHPTHVGPMFRFDSLSFVHSVFMYPRGWMAAGVHPLPSRRFSLGFSPSPDGCDSLSRVCLGMGVHLAVLPTGSGGDKRVHLGIFPRGSSHCSGSWPSFSRQLPSQGGPFRPRWDQHLPFAACLLLHHTLVGAGAGVGVAHPGPGFPETRGVTEGETTPPKKTKKKKKRRNKKKSGGRLPTLGYVGRIATQARRERARGNCKPSPRLPGSQEKTPDERLERKRSKIQDAVVR